MMEHQHPAPDTGNFFSNLFQVYIPRNQCMFHEAGLINLHIASDIVIALSYYSIPLALIYFARRRRDLAYNWMFLLFALFIILCGTTHIFSILAMWYPLYRVDGIVKMLTAIASIATAVLLWRLMPHALALPSQVEITRRRDELELLVSQRTTELTEANEALKDSEEKFKSLAEKAETANKAKTDFLANMSHELRTPMNAVVGLSNILAMNKALPARESEMVKTLQVSAQSLMSLINDLLDISKIESNSVKVEQIPFALSEVINEVLSVLSVRAEEKHIVMESGGCSPLDETLFIGDPLRIRQIVMNLVSNAIKFTEHGTVGIRLKATEGNGDIMDVLLTVSDTGIGIPHDKLEAIFDKFSQADTSITRKYGGTGLGLAISKSLAEMMGGTLTVKSDYGHGAEFTLYLPLAMAGSNAHPARAADKGGKKSRRAKTLRILLVEDYKPNVLVAQSMLEDLGYEVDVAMNGKEALEKVRKNRMSYAAVLMDIQMPHMDGLEATYFLREEEKENNAVPIPVIAITAHALRGDREKCLEAGMNDYIAKPFEMNELKTVLETILARKEAV